MSRFAEEPLRPNCMIGPSYRTSSSSRSILISSRVLPPISRSSPARINYRGIRSQDPSIPELRLLSSIFRSPVCCIQFSAFSCIFIINQYDPAHPSASLPPNPACMFPQHPKWQNTNTHPNQCSPQAHFATIDLPKERKRMTLQLSNARQQASTTYNGAQEYPSNSRPVNG